jgi:hypothetical protein
MDRVALPATGLALTSVTTKLRADGHALQIFIRRLESGNLKYKAEW